MADQYAKVQDATEQTIAANQSTATVQPTTAAQPIAANRPATVETSTTMDQRTTAVQPVAVNPSNTANEPTAANRPTAADPATQAEQSVATDQSIPTDQSAEVAEPVIPPPYTQLKAHTAKCEACDKKNKGLGWQCTKCIVKFCQACVEERGEVALRRWHPPCFRTHGDGSKARRRRKRVRDSTDETLANIEAGVHNPTQVEEPAQARPLKTLRMQTPEASEDRSQVSTPASEVAP